MNLKKGLIIQREHCENILNGSKLWEMRSKITKFRGEFGLIISGTGMVYGKVRLIHVSSARIDTEEKWARSIWFHKCDEFMPQRPVPWLLRGAVKFDEPIPYKHKNGCVTWVNL